MRAFVFALLALVFCTLQRAQAVTKTWDGGSANAGDWGSALNWNGDTLPAVGDDILFNNAGQSPLEDIFLNASRTINSLTLNLTVGTNQNWNLAADNGTSAFTLTLATGNISVLSTSGTGTYIIGATTGGSGIGTGIMTLATSGTGFTFDNSRTNGGLLQINAIVSGALKTVTKTGAGTVILSGVNTYTGNTIVSAGTLTVGAGGSLTNTDITVGTGATLNINGNINTGSKNVTVEGTSGSPATATLGSGGSLSTYRTFVGYNGYGTFTQSGGTHSPSNYLLLGRFAGSSGTYNLSAGTISSTGTYVGYSGTGTFNLSGSGSLSSSFATTVGADGSGTFTQSGGVHTNTAALYLGYFAGGSGTYNLSAGTLSAGTTYIGLSGSGTFTQSGGTHTASTLLQLGNAAGSSGIYHLNGGTLTTPTVARGGGTGTFNFNGGTLQANQTHTNFMTGLTAANVMAGGAKIDTNGYDVIVGQALAHDPATGAPAVDGGLTKLGSGTLTLTGANTFTGATTINGGTLTAASSFGGALGSTSALTVNSGGTLLLGASNQINDVAPLNLNGGTFAKGDFSEGSTSTAGVGALTLSATGSHLDFGTGAVGTLTFASFTPGTFSLTIDNWTGTASTIGSATTDRLIFASSQSANLGSFVFTGYGAGAMEFSLGGGYYEITPVTPVPEPSTYSAATLALGLLACHLRRRSRRQKVAPALKRGPAA